MCDHMHASIRYLILVFARSSRSCCSQSLFTFQYPDLQNSYSTWSAANMKCFSLHVLGRPSLVTDRLLIPQCRLYSQRHSSIITTITVSSKSQSQRQTSTLSLPPLSLMPTPLLLRSYLITSIISSPLLLKASTPLLNLIAHSKSRFLDPDQNRVIGFLVRKIIYEHFVAGDCEARVKKTVAQMKKTGFTGVILGYAKEFSINEGEEANEAADVQEWKNGYLKTLSMIEEGDFLAMK